MQDFKRSDRVGSAMQRTLSELLPRLKQAPPGMVTIQEVRVSRDLSHAKVFYTVLGAEVDAVQDNLEYNAGSLRRSLGQAIKLHSMPELHFVHDSTLEEGNRLQGLIEDAVASDRHADEEQITEDK